MGILMRLSARTNIRESPPIRPENIRNIRTAYEKLLRKGVIPFESPAVLMAATDSKSISWSG